MRLTREERREQLLDTAAQVLLHRRGAPLTMEGLAAAAGVSKATPYLHFDNSDDVLAALHDREMAHMAARIGAALHGVDGEARVPAAVGAYLDVIAERGAILALLQRPEPETAGATSFVTDLLRDAYDLPLADARVAAGALYGALGGLVASWARGQVSRRTVERLAVETASSLARALARAGR